VIDRVTPFTMDGKITERIDEIVATNASVHMEMMDGSGLFLSITHDGIEERYWIRAKKNSLIVSLAERICTKSNEMVKP